jgi:hypothetical protein
MIFALAVAAALLSPQEPFHLRTELLEMNPIPAICVLAEAP